jgi:uncharacterized membrane protein
MEFLSNIDNSILVGLKVCIIAILGDTAIGWLIALTKKEFDIRKAPQFLKTNVLPYIGGLIIVALLAISDSTYMPVFLAVVTAITAKFGVEVIKDKVLGMFQER